MDNVLYYFPIYEDSPSTPFSDSARVMVEIRGVKSIRVTMFLWLSHLQAYEGRHGGISTKLPTESIHWHLNRYAAWWSENHLETVVCVASWP